MWHVTHYFLDAPEKLLPNADSVKCFTAFSGRLLAFPEEFPGFPRQANTLTCVVFVNWFFMNKSHIKSMLANFLQSTGCHTGLVHDLTLYSLLTPIFYKKIGPEYKWLEDIDVIWPFIRKYVGRMVRTVKPLLSIIRRSHWLLNWTASREIDFRIVISYLLPLIWVVLFKHYV